MDCRVQAPGNDEMEQWKRTCDLTPHSSSSPSCSSPRCSPAASSAASRPWSIPAADDDAFCRANNVAVGSNDYVNCRKNRDVQRGNANARTDRAQRNLAEHMLNNPTRP